MKLIDACEFIVDCPHSTAPNEGSGYPLIRTPNIGKGRLCLDGVHRVSESVYNSRVTRGVPQDNDLILAREALPGNVAIIKNGLKVCLGQRTVLIRPNVSIVNPDYLTYYLLAPKQQYNLISSANGATVAHINMPKIRGLNINLPPLNIQQRIASILCAYDDLIENNQKQIKLLEEAVQRLYKEWFVDLKFPGYASVKFVDNLPEGWTKGVVEDIAIFKRGKTITAKELEPGFIPVVAGGIEPAYYHNKSITEAPVITVSGSGANAGFTKMYYEKIWASDCSYVDSTSTNYLNFVYCFLKRKQGSVNNLQKGSAQPHVYAKDINALELIIATDEILSKFEEKTKPIFKQISLLISSNKLLIEARDRLLPKLMSGEIEV